MFVDRHEHLSAISGEMNAVRRDPTYLRVVEVTGLGGVGKTRLMHELKEAAPTSGTAPRLLWVTLENERQTGSLGPLLALRDQLPINCLLFDAAIVRIWAATGQPFQLKPDRVTKSLVFKTVDAGRAASGEMALPLTFAVDAFRAAAKKITGLLHYSQAEFEGIDTLGHDPEALRERLPHYLGLDMTRRPDERVVVFYDAYDRQSPATLVGRGAWLQEFIATLGRGLHVIASRERLGWSPEWAAITLPVAVGALPEPEAVDLIRDRVPDASPEIQAKLLAASERMPFFLDAALIAYSAHRATAGTVTVDELPATQDDAVAYLLKHLEPGYRDAAIAMAIVQRFDADLFTHIVRELNLPVGLGGLDWIQSAFFTEAVTSAGHGQVFKTHDVLTAFVRRSPQYRSSRERVLTAALRHLSVRLLARWDGPSSDEAALLDGVLSGWACVEDMPDDTIELLVDACYVLYDSGYWRELLAAADTGSERSHPTHVISEYFAALSARRTSGVSASIQRLGTIEPQVAVLGRHRRSFDLELAYLSELDGNYSRARQEFQRLFDAAAALDPNDRNQLRAWLYQADMATMDGDLVSAARLLLDAAERVGHAQPVTRAELLRHRAHTFRFSFEFERSTGMYADALQAVPNAPGLTSKLLTNLAESRCWTLPELALRDSNEALEIHGRLGNRLEMAKCEAARAVAHAKRGTHDAALDAVRRATSHAESAGYRAGVAFALQAGVIAAAGRGDVDGTRESLRSLRQTIDAIGTYGHLVVPALLAAGELNEYEAAIREVRWIAPEAIDARVRAAVRCR